MIACCIHAIEREVSMKQEAEPSEPNKDFSVFRSLLSVIFVVKHLCCSICVLHLDSPDCIYYIKGTLKTFLTVQGIFASRETRGKLSRLKEPNQTENQLRYKV